MKEKLHHQKNLNSNFSKVYQANDFQQLLIRLKDIKNKISLLENNIFSRSS